MCLPLPLHSGWLLSCDWEALARVGPGEKMRKSYDYMRVKFV